MRATKLRHTPNDPDWVRAEWQFSRTFAAQPFEAEVRVSSVASGGHANRYGAYGELPMPADTCSQDRPPSRPAYSCSPFAMAGGRSQFVVSAPHPGTHT